MQVVELVALDLHEGTAARASYLGENFEVLAQPGVVSFRKELVGEARGGRFRRGDVNVDGQVSVADAISLPGGRGLFRDPAGPPIR